MFNHRALAGNSPRPRMGTTHTSPKIKAPAKAKATNNHQSDEPEQTPPAETLNGLTPIEKAIVAMTPTKEDVLANHRLLERLRALDYDELLAFVKKQKGLKYDPDVQKLLHWRRVRNMTVPMAVEIAPFSYGLLCAAAKVHNVESPEEALELFLEQTLCDWSSDDFVLPSDFPLPSMDDEADANPQPAEVA